MSRPKTYPVQVGEKTYRVTVPEPDARPKQMWQCRCGIQNEALAGKCFNCKTPKLYGFTRWIPW